MPGSKLADQLSPLIAEGSTERVTRHHLASAPSCGAYPSCASREVLLHRLRNRLPTASKRRGPPRRTYAGRRPNCPRTSARRRPAEPLRNGHILSGQYVSNAVSPGKSPSRARAECDAADLGRSLEVLWSGVPCSARGCYGPAGSEGSPDHR